MLGLGDNLAQSVAALRAYGLRSALTITGLVMGVATIIAVISLIRGANHYVENKVANLGTDVFQVAKTPLASGSFSQFVKAARYRKFGDEDLKMLAAQCRDCGATGASVVSYSPVRRGRAEVPMASVIGHTASMAEIDSRVLAGGRYFAQTEDDQGAPVCLVGDRVRTELFGDSDPVGGVIRLGAMQCTVVGWFEKVGAVLGVDADTFVVLPLSGFARLRGTRHSLTLNVRAASRERMESALDETRQILRARRQLGLGQPDDFFVGTKQSLMAFWASLSSVFFVAFIVVSSITAMVAGIVIMNVTLVSVTERAREIGLRRALGASQSDIRRQFLTESLLQCLVGGAVGVGVGFAAADLVEGATAFPVRVELWMVAAGLVFSSAIGLVFGLAPAMSAARMDPVEALRSE